MGQRLPRETEGTERVWEEDSKGLVGYGSKWVHRKKRGNGEVLEEDRNEDGSR